MKKFNLLLLALASAFGVQAQNSCAEAQAIPAGFHAITEINGSGIPTLTCVGSLTGVTAAEWYAYTPVENLNVSVSTDFSMNSGHDTRVSVYSGTCGSLVCEGGDDDSGAGLLSFFSMNVVAGTTYYIVFDNYWESDGFSFAIIENPVVISELNFTATAFPGSGSVLGIADMNLDTYDDLISVNGSNLTITYQTEGEVYNPTTYDVGPVTHTPSWSLCSGDLDKNGYNDLIYAGGSGVSFVMANATGTGFTESAPGQYIFCQRSNMVDINADGNLDLFVCHDVAPNVFYMNDGSNVFEWNQGGLGDTPDGGNYGSVWIDYDNDCDMDMYIAKCRGAGSPASIDQLHRNNGDGTFTEVGVEANMANVLQTWSSAWADYDNDGDMDALVGASSFSSGGHQLMLNNGDGTFTEVTDGSGWDVYNQTGIEYAPGDFNNDGYVDVLASGNHIMINNGDMTFTAISVPFSNGPIGDMNDDGYLDVANGGNVFLNETTGNNYLKINTVGTTDNKNGIGARITIESDFGTQIRDVRSGEGFRYMSTMTTHFGLENDSEVERITICWPTGVIDVIDTPTAVNQTLTIVQGSHPVSVEDQEAANFSVYPNPANDRLILSGDSFVAKGTATVYDLAGKVVMATSLTTSELNIVNLPVGFYILKVESNGKLFEEKFSKI
jgi:hypothetical protein